MNRPVIFGILNLTPDSFSDGNCFITTDAALGRAKRLITDGADFIDVGGESSRPGASSLTADTEWKRIEAVVKQLVEKGVKVSVDSYHESTMHHALDAGVNCLNNIKGIFPASVVDRIASDEKLKNKVSLIAMHMHGSPEFMQESPLSADKIFPALDHFYSAVRDQLRGSGIRCMIDPGFGFGKTDGGNLKALQWCISRKNQGPFMIGVSRKGWFSRQFNDPNLTEPQNRDPHSHLLELGMMMAGIEAVRTHDVKILSTWRSQLFGEFPAKETCG